MKHYKLLIILMFLILQSGCGFSQDHPYFITHMKVSPSGRYLLAGRLDNKVIVWDVQNKKQLYAWGSTEENFLSWQAHFTADEKYVVILKMGSNDLMFINLETGKLDKVFPLPAQATTVAFYKDGKRFIWGGIDGRIQYEDMEKKETKVLKVPLPRDENLRAGDVGPISQIIISPDEQYFVSATNYDSVYDDYEDTDAPYYPIKGRSFWYIKHVNINLWDAKTLEKIHRLKGDKLNVKIWVSFSPDGKTVYGSTENGYAYAWDSENGNVKYQFQDRGAYDGTGTLQDNHYYCGMGKDPRYIKLMSTTDGKFVKEMPFSNATPVFGQMITHDATNMIFIGTEDGSVSMYRFDPKKLVLELYWHPDPVKRGLITWLSENDTLGKTSSQISEMRAKYIGKQQEMGFGEQDKSEKELISK